MEDLLISPIEHQILQKNKKQLESNLKIKMNMPLVSSDGSEDIIFVNVVGDTRNIYHVKKFLKHKVDKMKSIENHENIVVLDDDSEEESILPENNVNTCTWRRDKALPGTQEVNPIVDLCVSKEVSFTNNSSKSLKRKVEKTKSIGNQENNISVVILDDDSEEESILSENNKRRRKKTRFEKQEVNTAIPLCSDPSISKDVSFTNNNIDESVLIIDPSPPAEDFIPLHSSFKPNTLPQSSELSPITLPSSSGLNSKTLPSRSWINLKAPPPVTIDLCSDDETEDKNDRNEVNKEPPKIPLLIAKRLRPIVIDGSNVARQHGKPSNTFSCKGIKISVEYFLKRGHDQVTVFVPRFRRYCANGKFPTTDGEILDELEGNQNLSYTPSRRLNGKLISSYDDRFIVKLASEIGGAVVSNDNYKDLVGESEQFREVIEKRLVMFCFAGDIFMIPSDPLGFRGPTIEEVLSFPPTENPSS